MGRLNHHYTKLPNGYLFGEINRRAQPLKEKGAPLINLGIGDVTHPIPPSILEALIQGSIEMGNPESFKGYGPSQGYSFLREAIAANDYENLDISAEEIFISDGAKNDLANLQELFAQESRIALPNPAYPVYIDTNVMAGRTRPLLKRGGYGGVVYLPLLETKNFFTQIPNRPVDLIYLCSPNNPTGTSMSREELTEWVAFAKKHQAVILFDGAYEAYIRSPSPRSIYEIEGAKEVAIEVRSFSKTAGFSGLRCSYTVIPHALKVIDSSREHSLHALWTRRQETKFNGTSYPIQKAA
jgi:LL-diaminopimelate aminotransferase